MATTTTHGGGHGHGAGSRLHEDLPHFSEFHIKHPPTILFHITLGLIAVLLAITVGLYYVDLQNVPGFNLIPGINLIAALAVATIKAFLVVRNFMNLRGSTQLTVLWAALGFIWLLLMGGIFLDYKTRPASPGWQGLEFQIDPRTTEEIKRNGSAEPSGASNPAGVRKN